MSNLDKLMTKLNSQKSVKKVDEVPEIEEPVKKVEKLPEVPVVEDVEEEDDEDENGEVPVEDNEVTETHVTKKEDINKIQQQRAEEIQILQNDGVFRVEMLYQLTQINENLKDLNTLIAGVINGK